MLVKRQGLCEAQQWMDCGLIDAAVVGGDSLCLSTLHGFNALQLLSSEICRPFDSARNSISIGEAADLFCLSGTGCCQSRRVRPVQ
jgi:3-oxoacyl-[acyl-carrier-protein] synthase-1